MMHFLVHVLNWLNSAIAIVVDLIGIVSTHLLRDVVHTFRGGAAVNAGDL